MKFERKETRDDVVRKFICELMSLGTKHLFRGFRGFNAAYLAQYTLYERITGDISNARYTGHISTLD